MNIKNMYYPEVEIIKHEVPEFKQEVRIENGILSVIIVNPNDGTKSWCRVDYLQKAKKANETILMRIIWALQEVQKDLNMSKAEMKRRFIEYSLISK